MFSVLKSIASIIVSLVNFVVHTLESVGIFIVNIPTYLAFTVDAVNILPSVVVPFALLAISIYVFYLLVGR